MCVCRDVHAARCSVARPPPQVSGSLSWVAALTAPAGPAPAPLSLPPLPSLQCCVPVSSVRRRFWWSADEVRVCTWAGSTAPLCGARGLQHAPPHCLARAAPGARCAGLLPQEQARAQAPPRRLQGRTGAGTTRTSAACPCTSRAMRASGGALTSSAAARTSPTTSPATTTARRTGAGTTRTSAACPCTSRAMRASGGALTSSAAARTKPDHKPKPKPEPKPEPDHTCDDGWKWHVDDECCVSGGGPLRRGARWSAAGRGMGMGNHPRAGPGPGPGMDGGGLLPSALRPACLSSTLLTCPLQGFWWSDEDVSPGGGVRRPWWWFWAAGRKKQHHLTHQLTAPHPAVVLPQGPECDEGLEVAFRGPGALLVAQHARGPRSSAAGEALRIAQQHSDR